MEYGLWLRMGQHLYIGSEVLILVLMEYGLWLKFSDGEILTNLVLILVLMEYGLWRRIFYVVLNMDQS